MIGRILFASILMACSPAVGWLGIAPAANAASTERSHLKSGKTAKNNVIELRQRSRSRRILLPIGPSYIYYEYPYYYSRGYYPTHIGGYVYYPTHFYSYRRCSSNWRHHRDGGSRRCRGARGN
jgi:hypothetical protein